MKKTEKNRGDSRDSWVKLVIHTNNILYGFVLHNLHTSTSISFRLGGGWLCEPAGGGCLLKGFVFHVLYYFRSLCNLYCKVYVAFRILD